MGYAELIERLRALPDDKQAEVFDFVEFLLARTAREDKPPVEGEWTNAEFADFSLSQAMRGMEDDPVTYTPADLKERRQ
ncbi:MAG: hypothetical protein A3G18_08040 [Rhodospirillales bacterium RIFCSPLOWO2_12_FULL_58_28]|nr:MAG: hypothetical protein A3H92_00430 [Rhodospirillales bacterium RIFCSPLOWO2_02_FULL_58_16]OHC78127.1 MAG: hypothetical protein A3G18_08040 [Rhodospirillales bacterium RIFCSPLOWO2_12_FULL_58_28]